MFWTAPNSSGNPTLFVKPTPTNAQPSNVSYVAYPTIDVDADTLDIPNFPDEATYLVVTYAASRQLLKFQATMSASWNATITTALGAIKTELDKADNVIATAEGKVDNYYSAITELENAELWDNTNERFIEVKLALNTAKQLIGLGAAGDKYATDNDLESIMLEIDDKIDEEDVELANARMQQAQNQMNAFQAHLNTAQAAIGEIDSLMKKHSMPLAGVPQYMSNATGYISQASGYVAEATARLQQDTSKYNWYGDQYAKLSAEYARGLAALKGGA